MPIVLIQWLIFLHVLSAIGFLLFHGASAAMAFQVRKETDFARIRALLDVSQSTFTGMFASFLVLGLTGLALPFLVRVWDKGYIWASIVLILGVVTYMGFVSESLYKKLRWLVGLPYMKGGGQDLPGREAGQPRRGGSIAEEDERGCPGDSWLSGSCHRVVVDDVQAVLVWWVEWLSALRLLRPHPLPLPTGEGNQIRQSRDGQEPIPASSVLSALDGQQGP